MQALKASKDHSSFVLCILHLVLCLTLKNQEQSTKDQSTKVHQQRNLPMIDQKKTSELIETSLVYLLSAAVAVGAFVLVWLISLLFGLDQG